MAELKNAIAAAGEKYNPMPSGYLKMIPANSKQYAEASKLYDNYTQHIQDVRMDSIKHEQKMELERLAQEQVKLQHQQKASMRIADGAVSRPFDSSDSGTDSTGSKLVESFKKHPFLWCRSGRDRYWRNRPLCIIAKINKNWISIIINNLICTQEN